MILKIADCKTRQYREVPNVREDNVIPPVSDIPSILTTMRYPRKSRSVSIGPQSEADVYETLAYREKRRRESMSEMMKSKPTSEELGNMAEMSSGGPRPKPPKLGNNGNTVKVGFFKDEIDRPLSDIDSDPRTLNDASQYEKEEREMFSQLEKPRVRYDVEVMTKLIVYSGKI